MEKIQKGHPSCPRSNVNKLGNYDPEKYAIDHVSQTVLVDEDLTPNCPPCLTHTTIGKFLQPLTRELTEVPPSPTIDELPDAVINRMVVKDKAFWVDKPGSNAYTLHDAYYNYGMTTKKILPTPQSVFPRSYQYDLDCVKYRRHHACDAIRKPEEKPKRPAAPHCRDCRKIEIPGLTPFQLAWTSDEGQKRWRYYPDLSANLSQEEIRELMKEVGRPFQSEACNWYNKNYPSVKYECILRKFSK